LHCIQVYNKRVIDYNLLVKEEVDENLSVFLSNRVIYCKQFVSTNLGLVHFMFKVYLNRRRQ